MKIEFKNGSSIITTTTSSMKRSIRSFAYMPYIGDKLSDYNHTKEGCEKLAEELENLGYKTRVNYMCEDPDYWTVAIIDMPERIK